MEEIGSRLRAAREAKGISLEVAEDETKIRRRYLEALENGRADDIPGEVYLKGFLRTYGNFLGLDGPGLVEEYKAAKEPPQESLPQTAGEPQAEGGQPVEKGPVEQPTPRMPVVPAFSVPRPRPAKRHKQRRPGARGRNNRRAFVRLFVLLVAVTALAWLGWWAIGKVSGMVLNKPSDQGGQATAQGQADTTPKPDPVASSLVTEEKPTEQTKVTMTTQGKSVLFTVAASEVQLRVEPGQKLWMEVRAEGKVIYSGTQSEPKEFKGKRLEVSVGHLQGVTLIVNGQQFKEPLKSGPFKLVFQAQ